MADCFDGSSSPLPDPDYEIEGSVIGCGGIHRVRLLAQVKSVFIGHGSSVSDWKLDEVLTGIGGTYRFDFNWCSKFAPILGERPGLPGGWRIVNVLEGVQLRVYDPGTELLFESRDISLTSNYIVANFDLTENEACDDRVEAYRLSVTQAVRTGPLIAGKRSVARLYARPLRYALGELEDVAAELRAFRNGTELSGSPISAWTESITLAPWDSDLARESNQEKTWNFILPNSWTRSGEVELRARVDPSNALGECQNCQDNNEISKTVKLETGHSLTIQPLRIWENRGGVWHMPSVDDVTSGLAGIVRTYPYSSLTILPPFRFDRELNESSGDLVDRILDTYTCYDSFLGWIFGCEWSTYYIGFLNLDGYCPGGRARLDSPGCVSDWNAWTAAQELAHCMGLHHAGHCHKEDGYDPAYPDQHGATDGGGFDTTGMVAVPKAPPYPAGFPDLPNANECSAATTCGDEDHTHDFMSYGDAPRWISSYTYYGLYQSGFSGSHGVFRVLSEEEAARSEWDARRVLHLRGKIRRDGRLALGHFFTGASHDRVRIREGYGSFRCVALSRDGEVLAMQSFEPAPDVADKPSRVFSVLMPFPEGTHSIEVVRGGEVLAKRTVSEHAPRVKLEGPQGGERFTNDDAIDVRWQGRDEDGDELRYGVQFSSDDGRSWMTLGRDLVRPHLRVRVQDIPGGSHCRVRVAASDGVLTEWAMSEESFYVEESPPFVVIFHPRDGQVINFGKPIILEGSAGDRQDISIAHDQFVWRSDRDGVLGKGPSLVGSPLGAGTHEITLEVKNRAGLTDLATSRVDVRARHEPGYLDVRQTYVPEERPATT
jgi:hypothetical protein